MPGFHARCGIFLCLLFLSVATLLPGLGSSGRLTYHEAFVAQGAREILASGNWVHPTIGGLPWLEKPPLPWWLVAGLGHFMGGVTATVARFPSALAAMVLSLGVAVLGWRHYGTQIGFLAGAVQATTAWTVGRGRLAEADILLACLITWTIVAFDSMLATPPGEVQEKQSVPRRSGAARWVFFTLLGMTSLVKGIGFGAVLILAIVAGFVVWHRDGAAVRRLQFRTGWAVTAIITLAWPLLIVALYGSGALRLWTMHVADRVAAQTGPGSFAGESWWEYTSGLLGQTLPWTPFAFVGAWSSLGRAVRRQAWLERRRPSVSIPATVVAGDRLLWIWAVMPLGLLAMASVKNAHYAISAQVPWSIWAALGVAQLGKRLQLRGWDRRALRLVPKALFATLAVSYGLGYWLIAPWFDRRGVEWAFYESACRRLSAGVPLTLLYDDWDRNPYESPFGRIPHDLAVRLFYLGRLACWHMGPDSLSACDHRGANASFNGSQMVGGQSPTSPSGSAFCVIGRDRDRPMLEQLGSVQVLVRGPNVRFDRTYSLFCVTSKPKPGALPWDLASSPFTAYHQPKAGCGDVTADLW
jgi:4-amino-4-deoxy-L-arabinose transferase-like glycosyltransferase